MQQKERKSKKFDFLNLLAGVASQQPVVAKQLPPYLSRKQQITGIEKRYHKEISETLDTLTVKIGDKVKARYMGGIIWYNGKVTDIKNIDGTVSSYNIDYDDGDKETDVMPENVRPQLFIDDFWKGELWSDPRWTGWWKGRKSLPEYVVYMSDYFTIKDSQVLPEKGFRGLFAKKEIPKGVFMGPYPAFLYEDEAEHSSQRSFHIQWKKNPYMWDIGHDMKYFDDPHYLDYINSVTFETTYKELETYLKKIQRLLGIRLLFVPSNKQNCEVKYINGIVFYKTTRPIQRDEELIINYGEAYLVHLVDTLLYSVWKETLDTTTEGQIAFHRLSICWALSQIEVKSKMRKYKDIIHQDLDALETLYEDDDEIIQKIKSFRSNRKLLLEKLKKEAYSDWKRPTIKRQRQKELTFYYEKDTVSKRRKDQSLELLRRKLTPLIDVRLPKYKTLADYNTTEIELAKIGLRLENKRDQEDGNFYHIFTRI